MKLAPSPEIAAIEQSVGRLRARIELELTAVRSILQGQPSLDMLQAQQQLWQQRQLQTTGWLTALTQRATRIEEALTRLSALRTTWRRTHEAAVAGRAPGLVLGQVETALAEIETTEMPLSAQRTAVLDLQNAVAREVSRCGAALAELAQAQQHAVGGMLDRESPPLWSASRWAQAVTALPARLHEVAVSYRTDIERYAGDPRGLRLHLVAFALLALLFVQARRRIHRGTPAAPAPSTATAVFERPYAATVVVALLAVSSPYVLVPLTTRSVFVALGLAAAIRLTRLTVDPRIVPELYTLWVLFALDTLRGVLAGVPVVEQALLVLESLGGLGVLGYSVSRGALRATSDARPRGDDRPGVRLGACLLMAVFAVTALAAAAGYLPLARLLASGILGSGALALMLHAGVRVLTGVVAFALRIWPLRLLHLVQDHRELLERRTARVLGWGAALGWVVRTLDYVGLLQSFFGSARAVLTTELGRGSIRLSLGNILEFVLTVWLAYLCSVFIRFVLREDVYPRTRLTRGMSYAISSLLNYVIIALGFVLALGVLGMDLNKVTILASAFGVGIGFGLQSVVNNFVSGLILLFERPIHVGDIVELSDLSGEVSRIGIRASTVRTWQGAEIIVPNAQLISERVTNWTLSDRTRRIDLKVGVDYGSPPDKVVEVLEAVARNHPHIMQTPAPQAVFSAFGDSSINFQLRAWTNRFERWPNIQTELAAAVYAALHAAGMSLPFPQREVRVLHDPPTRPTLPTAVGADPPAGTDRPPRLC